MIRFSANYYLVRSWRSMLRVELKDFDGAMVDYNYLSFSNEDELNPDMAWEFRYRGIAKPDSADLQSVLPISFKPSNPIARIYNPCSRLAVTHLNKSIKKTTTLLLCFLYSLLARITSSVRFTCV